MSSCFNSSLIFLIKKTFFKPIWRYLTSLRNCLLLKVPMHINLIHCVCKNEGYLQGAPASADDKSSADLARSFSRTRMVSQADVESDMQEVSDRHTRFWYKPRDRDRSIGAQIGDLSLTLQIGFPCLSVQVRFIYVFFY